MKALFYSVGTLAFIFLIFQIGDIVGILEGNLLGEVFSKFTAPSKALKPSNYYILLALTSVWALLFCIINLKFSSHISKFMIAGLGKSGIAAFLCVLLYIVVSPGMDGRHIAISYYEWPPDIRTFLYQEDALLEMLTVGLLLLSSIQFYLAGKHAAKHSLKQRTAVATLFFTLSIFSMFFLMEEISWGQRFFSWETPTQILEINHQNETNFHNIINPIILDGELILSLFISLALLLAMFYRTRKTSPTIQKLFPTEKYYYISIFIVIAARLSTELFEEVFAILIFSYSRDMWKNYSPTRPKVDPFLNPEKNETS